MSVAKSPFGACQGRVRPGFSMERKERKFGFKHYEVLDKMSCVVGLVDLRTDKPQSIETRPSLNIKKQTINQRLESRPKQTDAMIV